MARYWSGAATPTNSNWNANVVGVTNWGSASGVADNVAAPTSADDVFFDGAGVLGNTNSIISAIISCKSLTISAGYTVTMTHNATLTIAGSWAMHNGFTIAGASVIIISAASTIASGGKTWPNSLTFAVTGTVTVTINGNFTLTGTLSITNGSSTTLSINKTTSEAITCGGLSITGGGTTVDGTVTKIIVTGGTITSVTNLSKFSLLIELAGTITITSFFSGSWLYTSGTITHSGTLYISNTHTSSIDTNNNFTWNTIQSENVGSNTITLISDLKVNTLTSSGTSRPMVINGPYVITVYTAITCTSSFSNPNADTTINFISGVWSGAQSISISLNLNGNITISGNVVYVTRTLTYVSGTITTTGSTLTLTGTGCTLNTNGIVWNNITSSNSLTVTLTSNLTATGITTISNPTVINSTTSETWSTNGVTVNAPTSGTAKIILTGGTWQGSNTVGIGNSLDLQGNVTLATNVYYRAATLTYISGTITVAGSTLNLTTTCTLNTVGVTWNNITTSTTTGQTYTINSLLSVSGTLTLGITTTQTFAGTSGFTTATLSCLATTGATINLKESITYTVTGAFSCSSSRVGSIVLFTSSHGTTRANLVLPNNGTVTCTCLASFTRIDASGGRTINGFNSVVTDCINVREFHDFQTANIA